MIFEPSLEDNSIRRLSPTKQGDIGRQQRDAPSWAISFIWSGNYITLTRIPAITQIPGWGTEPRS